MDLQNLREHHEELLSFMENNGYSSTYIQRFRDEINRILADADSSRWQSYRDVYLEYLKVPHSKDYLRNKRTIIGALEQFDLFGRLPDGRHRHTLFERGSYHLLEPEFQELIDFYRMYEKQRGKKESTIRGESLNTASFLYQMQEQGAQCLDEVTEDAVLSFFVSEDGSPRKGCSYKKNISAVFKAGLNWKEPQCQRILSFLPLLRETRKTIQYLTQDEIRLLRAAVESSGFSARNKAVILLLLFTGLRGCDIAGLTFSSIDWEKERILVEQQKTSMPVEIPLSAVVGNAIYDYLEQERPDTGALSLFLTETHPFSPISAQGINEMFFVHLTLVCTLLIVFPFSKLAHMPGIFFSPTRNMANNSRRIRHINPWNPPKQYFTYKEYEDTYREAMAEAGLPLDKPLDKAAE